MDNEKNTSADSIRVKLNFRVPSRMPTLYAHHMTIQPSENEVLLSFFEVIPPLTLGEPEDQIKALQETGVIAECVARITVAKNTFPDFTQAMQQTLSQMSSEPQGTEEGQNNADNSRNNQQG